MFQKKKPIKIEFVSRIKGVAEMFPILEASQYKRKWVNTAMANYKENRQEMQKQTHVVRCPGIFSLLKRGYIITSWCDVSITTKKGQEGFDWKLPMKADHEGMYDVPPIDAQLDDLAKWIPKRDGQIKTLVKINSPLNVIAPKGVKFLILPVPYPDQFDFECATGILDPAESIELNVQLNWHKEDGEVIIKAGTPLAYLIPLYDSEREVEIINRDATEKELEFVKKVNNAHALTFSPSRSRYRQKIKNMYAKYFLD
jgi:hypothetical protein